MQLRQLALWTFAKPVEVSVISQFDGPAIKLGDGSLNSESAVFGEALFNVADGPHMREQERRQV